MYAPSRAPEPASTGPAPTEADGPPATSGAEIERAPDSSALSGFSHSPLNQRAPRRKCHIEATDRTSTGRSTSWAKNVALASGWRLAMVTMR